MCMCVRALARTTCATGSGEEMSAPVHDDVPETGPGQADRPAGHGAGLSAGAGRVVGARGRRQPDARPAPPPPPAPPSAPSTAPGRRRDRHTGGRGPVAGPGQRFRRGAGRVPDGKGGRLPQLPVDQRQTDRLVRRGERAQAQQSDARQLPAHRPAGDR